MPQPVSWDSGLAWDNLTSGALWNGWADSGFADPDMEALHQKVNEMIPNGRR
jgi:hypothetical protein